QALARPLGVLFRVKPGNVNDGMIVLAVDETAGAFGMAPVGAGRPLPPLTGIVQRDGVVRRREYQRSRHEVLRFRRLLARWRIGHDLVNGRRALGGGDVTFGLDEDAELGVGDIGLVNADAVEPTSGRRLAASGA